MLIREARGPGNLPGTHLQRLAESLWSEQNTPPAGLPAERFPEWARAPDQELRRREMPPPGLIHVLVDGNAIPFDHLSEGAAWWPWATPRTSTITLLARSLAVEVIELVTVTDIDPYVEGTRRLRDRWRIQP